MKKLTYALPLAVCALMYFSPVAVAMGLDDFGKNGDTVGIASIAIGATLIILAAMLFWAVKASSSRRDRRRAEADEVDRAVKRLEAAKKRTSSVLESTDFTGARSRFLVSVARIPGSVGDPFKEWFDELLDKVSRTVARYDDLFNREEIPARYGFLDDINSLAQEFEQVADRITNSSIKAEDIIAEARRTAARCAPELVLEYMRSVTERLSGIERHLHGESSPAAPPVDTSRYMPPSATPPPYVEPPRPLRTDNDAFPHDGFVMDADVIENER